ncbi:MAG: methyl-accepting chemotaxis protein [Pseudomonadota bacterium]
MKHKRGFLNNLSIQTKLIGISGGLLTLLVGLCVVTFIGLHKLENSFGNYRANADYVALVADLKQSALQARVSALKFRANTDNMGWAEQTDTSLGTLLSTVADSRADVPSSLHPTLDALQESASAYRAAFAQAIALKREIAENEATLTDGRATLAGLFSPGPRTLAGAAVRDAIIVLDAALGGRLAADGSAAVRLRVLVSETAGYADVSRLIGTLADAAERVALLSANVQVIYADQLDAIGPKMVADLDAVADAVKAQTTDLFAQTADVMGQVTSAVLWGAGLTALLGAIGITFLIRATVLPLNVLSNRLSQLADAHTGFTIWKQEGGGEIGRMWNATATLKHKVTEAFTRAEMIEQLPIPIILANPHDEMRMTYMNKAAETALKRIDDLLPCHVEEMVGQSIDIFHKNPKHQRDIIADPSKLPWSARICVADKEWLDLNVVPLRDPEGNYISTMLAWEIVTDSVQQLATFETSVKGSAEDAAKTLKHMVAQIEAISSAAERTRAGLAEGSGAVGEAASNVQTVAAAAEQLSSSVAEIASQMAASTTRAQAASDETTRVAKNAADLSEASQRINEVAGTIAEIASKTNLLALNATIEAASAGEAGRAFAVVAQEVKSLAEQTARATEEVRQRSNTVLSLIDTVTTGVGEVSVAIQAITETFSSIATAAEEQQAATAEISQNAQEAAAGVSQAASSIDDAAGVSNENVEVARTLVTSASELTGVNDDLLRRSDEFIEMVRAA